MKKSIFNMILALAMMFICAPTALAVTSHNMPAATQAKKKYVIVQGVNVRLRFEPNLTCGWLHDSNGKPRHAPKGTKLEYLGESGNFYKVMYDGYQLYISKDYASIKIVDVPSRSSSTSSSSSSNSNYFVVVNGTNVRLRTGPGTNYSYFTWNDGSPCYLPKGSYLKYLGEQGDFYRCDYQGKTVYISKKFSYITK